MSSRRSIRCGIITLLLPVFTGCVGKRVGLELEDAGSDGSGEPGSGGGGSSSAGDAGQTTTGGAASAGVAGVAGAADGGSATSGGTGGAAGFDGEGGEAGSGVNDDCPVEPVTPQDPCQPISGVCEYETMTCSCEYGLWSCSGCPPEPVQSFGVCAPVDVACEYGAMTCTCEGDDVMGSWRCSGCSPEMPLQNSCYVAGFPLEGCEYGNTNCTCTEVSGLRCIGDCLPEWFSMVETSTNTPVPFTTEERDELVALLNEALHPFNFTIWVERDVHGHSVVFSSTTQWIVNSGLGSVQLEAFPPDGHAWTIECMP